MVDYRYVVRKRKQQVKRRKLNIKGVIYKVFILSVLSVFAGGVFYCYTFLGNKIKSGFLIKKIEIIGTKNVSYKTISKYMEKFRGKSLVSLKMNDIYNDIMKKNPWAKDVIIHKNYPNGVVVEILEEKPIGLVNCKGDFYILTETGKIIKKFDKKLITSGLSVFTFKSLKKYPEMKEAVLKIYKKINTLGLKNISEIVMKSSDIEIFTYKPYRKYIVDKGRIDENLCKIKEMDKIKARLGRDFTNVNLKYKDKIFIKL